MAKTTRSQTVLPPEEAAPAPQGDGSLEGTLTLPFEPSVVSNNINDYFVYIHGVPKIGKTTLATEDGPALLLTFDPENKSKALYQRHCPDWNHVSIYLTKLQELAYWSEREPNNFQYPYKKVVLDGMDLMYRYCQEWCERKLVVNHIGEEGFSRGWDLLHFTFRSTIQQFMALPGGCWFISHSEWKDIKTRNGPGGTKLVPDAKGYGGKVISALADVVAAYDYNGRERVLVIRGDENITAGVKVDARFLTPDGRDVYEVPMGHSPQEAWKYFMRAFHNKQPYVDINERDRMLAQQQARKEAQGKNLPK
jgi:hypothetical protein